MVDRKKYLIKTGGENVYPQEVEQVLLRHEAVAEAAVIGIPDERWGEAVTAFIVLKPGHELTRAAIADWVGATSPATRSRATSNSSLHCRATSPARS